ncbi:MAG: short-chain dehydrogenase [Rhodospirillaceae bacterium]|nr:short-chain dehydrogenase [Rhodospirillaceae bacterium]|tara:strand:+ start:211 stop:972 length:762 start_codon:yes stop_codon:yes gene_type:complete
MPKLEGKCAVITGGGTGIGRSTALAFAREGANIAILDWDKETSERTIAEIRAIGVSGLFFETDVSEAEEMERSIKGAASELGGLHILHNNAGGSSAKDGAVETLPLEEWWRTIKTDLFGTFLGCRFGIPELAKSGGGSIINMTSIRALVGSEGAAAYSTAKGGVIALTQALTPECAKKNIRINAIAPGVIKTDRVKKLLEAGEETGNDAIVSRHLLGLGEPNDIANLALFLASHDSRLITGTILPVDSGTSAT